jgi:cytochrome c-type biogenesis protein CcmE
MGGSLWLPDANRSLHQEAGGEVKRNAILIMVIVAAFGVFAATAFKHSLTPYVTFSEAEARGSTVQVSGVFPDEETAYFDAADGTFNFSLVDKDGRSMHVEYVGTPPNNFYQAESVVIVGKVQGATFKAEKILVKCPSKYQGGSDS